MVEAKTKDIDGFKVTVTTLTAMRSLKLMHRLVKAIGPGLLKSLAGVKGEVTSVGNLDVGALADGLQGVLDRLSEGDLEDTVKVLFETAMLERAGKSQPFMQTYDMAYAGNMPALLKTIQFGLEANYGNFFDALRKALPAAPAAASI